MNGECVLTARLLLKPNSLKLAVRTYKKKHDNFIGHRYAQYAIIIFVVNATIQCARSSGDRAPASGAGSAGSIPAGRTIITYEVRALKGKAYSKPEA